MSVEPGSSRLQESVPGPVDRRLFFEEQRRHRRVAGLLSLLVALATVLMGVPLSALLFPFFFALSSVSLDLLSLVLPVPDLWGAFVATGGHFAEGENAVLEGILIALLVCFPGAVTLLALWSYLWRRHMDPAMAGLAARAGARPPKMDDLEEWQLQNVVEEMAIAAGIGAPTVLVVDDPGINAGAFGTEIDRSTVFVTRGLLDGCDRDETQAVAGHLVALIANGDLRAIMRLIAAFTALGVVRKLVQVPLDAGVRARARQMLAYARTRWAQRGDPDIDREGAWLEWLLEEDELSDMQGGNVRKTLLLPFFMTYAMFNAVALMTAWVLLSPVLVPLLRSRRLLADATAIELNRHADALYRALARLVNTSAEGFRIRGVTDLAFVVAPKSREEAKESAPPLVVDLHPSIEKRHRRVGEIAHQRVRRTVGEWLRSSIGPYGAISLLLLILAPLVGTVIVLMLFLIVALTGIALIVGMIYAYVAAGLTNALLR